MTFSPARSVEELPKGRFVVLTLRKLHFATILVTSVTAIVVFAEQATAQFVAIILVCEKGAKHCNRETARSIYTLPMESVICFMPAQQELAKMVVYDEVHDDLRINCTMKAPG